jgi:plastocyanin
LQKFTRPLAATVALAAVALAPAAAQAATKTQQYGLSNNPAGTPDLAAFYDFFPRTIKVHVGDTVKYKINGFGVPYFGPKSGIEPLAAVDLANPVTGLNDPAGNPFWFNGQPTPGVNPTWLREAGDGKAGGVDHGALALGPSKPFTMKFKKPGSYKVYDGIHPAVTGKVVVVPEGKKIPSKAADKARAAKQAAKLAKQAKKLGAPAVEDNTILVGNDSKRVGFFGFFPGNLTVPVNTPVTIDGGDRLNDIHNLAIGPAPYLKSLSGDEEGKLFQPTETGLNLAAEVIYSSQPPTAPFAFSGTENGGFFNSGTLDTDAATPLPSKTTVTFTAPGQYTYYCLFHGDGVNPDQSMSGTITVQ